MKLCDEYNNSTKFQFYTEKGLRDIPFFVISLHLWRAFAGGLGCDSSPFFLAPL